MSRLAKTLSILLGCCTLLFTACGAPFKVAPRVEVPLESFTHRAETARVTVYAGAPLSEDEVVRLFDGNLLLAGLLPVRVSIVNQSSAMVETSRARFYLVTADGKRLKQVSPKDALKKLFDYYGVRTYNVASFETLRERFSAHALTFPDKLSEGAQVQGIIFFDLAKAEAPSSGLTLRIERLRIAQTKRDLTIDLELN